MSLLPLALKAKLPMIHVTSDDLIHTEKILEHLAGEPVYPLTGGGDSKDGALAHANVFYCASSLPDLVEWYEYCAALDKTIIFVNTDKSVIHFDAGSLVPPSEMILAVLEGVSDDPQELLPSFGGLSIKDTTEVAQLTMTRDGSLTSRGVSETRRQYATLRGITQVSTDLGYYVAPTLLVKWLNENAMFFNNPIHQALTPRGLLFTGKPGLGKTLGAKYIAHTLNVPLYRLDLGATMAKYVGESERQLGAILAQVDQVEPAVILIDEVEKVFQSSGDQGVTSRLLSQLLWWLQEHSTKVFTVMTTNDKSIIPPELYREGRIDAVHEFVGISNLEEAYHFVNQAITPLAKELGVVLIPAHQERLDKMVKLLRTQDPVMPQSKLIQTVRSFAKELLREKTNVQ